MESFLRIVEKKIRPPFKYFIVEQGCFKAASSRGFNTLKEAKIQAEEWVLNDKRSYSIMKVFFNKDEYRLGYMGMRILTIDNECMWERDLTRDFCLHVAFFFKDFDHRNWNPQLYDKLKKEWMKL